MMTENLKLQYQTNFVKYVLDTLIPIFLPDAGYVTFDGGVCQEAEGHFNDDRKPRGFNTKQIL